MSFFTVIAIIELWKIIKVLIDYKIVVVTLIWQCPRVVSRLNPNTITTCTDRCMSGRLKEYLINVTVWSAHEVIDSQIMDPVVLDRCLGPRCLLGRSI